MVASTAVAVEAPIIDAAMRGDIEMVRVLIRQGSDIDAAQGGGMTALHWAAANGDAEMAELLIGAGASLELMTRLGDYTPLHLAAKAGSAAVVELVLSAGAEPEASTSTGAATALHFAAGAGNVKAIKAILDRGADVDARELQWGQTPLMFAVGADRLEAVVTLLERGADPAIVSKVVDIADREEIDGSAQRERSRFMAESRSTSKKGSRQVLQGWNSGQDPRARAETPPSPGDPNLTPQEQLRGGTEIDPLSYADLVGSHGGLTALLLAARDGHMETASALLAAGAHIDQPSAGDHTSPLLIAAINGHYDLVLLLLEGGADPTVGSDAGATPLYAVLNTEWVPKSRHPQPTDSKQQRATYIDVMEALLQAGADPNARLLKTTWYTTYNNDLLSVDLAGATPFWRAAYATDVRVMRLLVSHGANPDIPTVKMPQRRRFSRQGAGEEEDRSGLPPVPMGGPAVYPIHAASGVGYGQGFAGNSHRHVPGGWLPAVRYLVEEHDADVNARDLNGYTPLHHAASRGDNDMILYLAARGADATPVSRRGQTTADMANGPVQRIQPFPETIALLESFGSKNSGNCVSC